MMRYLQKRNCYGKTPIKYFPYRVEMRRKIYGLIYFDYFQLLQHICVSDHKQPLLCSLKLLFTRMVGNLFMLFYIKHSKRHLIFNKVS